MFAADSGHDRIHDFQQGKDHIEVTGYAADKFDELDITPDLIDGKAAWVVHLDAIQRRHGVRRVDAEGERLLVRVRGKQNEAARSARTLSSARSPSKDATKLLYELDEFDPRR